MVLTVAETAEASVSSPGPIPALSGSCNSRRMSFSSLMDSKMASLWSTAELNAAPVSAKSNWRLEIILILPEPLMGCVIYPLFALIAVTLSLPGAFRG
jgi:hypothetical protein